MTAVIYARYSSDRQTEQSIEGQLRACHEYAEREKITIVAEYIDRAISGTTDKRPQFQQMIADSSSKTFDAVIVYKLDRFARDRYASAMYKQQLRKNGVRVVSAMENIADTPEGIILEGLLEAMNEYYSAELSQKIKRGMRENVIKGKTTGGNVALGYKIGADKKLEVEESGARIVRKIFDMYLQGNTYKQICDKLNAIGEKTSRGKAFTGSTISRILANRRYIGEYTAEGVAEQTSCPLIISRETFEKAQVRMSESQSRHRHHDGNRDYILTGKLICEKCECGTKGSYGTSKTGKKYYYYKCKSNCIKPAPAPELEDAVVDMISQFLSSDMCDMIADAAYQVYQKEREENCEAKQLQKEIKEVSKQIDNAISAIISGISSETLKATLECLEQKKTALEAELRQQSMKMPDLKPEHFRYFMRKFAEIKKADPDKSRLIESIVNKIILADDEITVLINLSDKAKTPPLTEIKSVRQQGFANIAIGGGNGSKAEHQHATVAIVSPFVICVSMQLYHIAQKKSR